MIGQEACGYIKTGSRDGMLILSKLIDYSALWKSCFNGATSPKTKPDVIVIWDYFYRHKHL
jgi:hypothetical protein